MLVAALPRLMSTAGMLALAPLVVDAGPGRAASIEAGKAIAEKGTAGGVAACATCHGAAGEGETNAGIPRLAGLDAGYQRAQLLAFANGTRGNPMKAAIAKAMDATAMADASAYYAGLVPPAGRVSGTPNPDAAKGEIIATRGDWSVGIPPCASCHGKRGHGVGAAFPAIAGQPAAYIAAQLRAWKNGARHDDPQALMKTVAGRLSEAQVAAVAAYYESLPAGPVGPAVRGGGRTP